MLVASILLGVAFMRWFILLLFLACRVEGREMEELSKNPKVYLIRNFLSDSECDYLISYAKPKLEPSKVAYQHDGQPRPNKNRTSSHMYCPYNHGDVILLSIEKRITELTSIPHSHGENIQIAHYAVGAEYVAHYDSFDLNTPGGAIYGKTGGQRKATFLMYLNTPEKGGSTYFPKVRVNITPVKGNAILFYNVDDTGKVDLLSLHGGAPVLAGEKWIATRWLRERPFK